MIFFVYSEPVSHFVEWFFFFCVSTSFRPCTIPCLFTRWKKNCCQVLFCMIMMKTFGFYLFEPTFRAIRAGVN